MEFKKLLVLFFICFLCFSPVCAAEQDDDTIKQFVFAVDDADNVLEGSVQITEQKPFLCDYIEQAQEEPQEEILLDTDFSPQIRVNQIKKVSTYSKSLDAPQNADFVVGKGTVMIGSKSYQYNDGNTLIKNVRQETGIAVKKNKFLLSAGLETTYDTTNITGASKGAFLTPKLQLSDRAAISVKNKLSGQDMRKYESTLGIDYKPKLIKNSSIWLGAGATVRDNVIESQTLNLKTDFYLW